MHLLMGCCTSRSGGFQSGRADGGGRDRGTQGFKPPRWKSTDPITDSELKVRTPRLLHRDDLRPGPPAMPPLPPCCLRAAALSFSSWRVHLHLHLQHMQDSRTMLCPPADLVMSAWRSGSARSSGTQHPIMAATEVSVWTSDVELLDSIRRKRISIAHRTAVT